MSIYQDWKNGRKLSDPNAFQEVKDMLFAVDYPLGETPNDELMDAQTRRERSKINQAR